MEGARGARGNRVRETAWPAIDVAVSDGGDPFRVYPFRVYPFRVYSFRVYSFRVYSLHAASRPRRRRRGRTPAARCRSPT